MTDTSNERVKRLATDLYRFANAKKRAEAADMLLALVGMIQELKTQLQALTELVPGTTGYTILDALRGANSKLIHHNVELMKRAEDAEKALQIAVHFMRNAGADMSLYPEITTALEAKP